jgi:hypothetical protein
LGLLRKHCAGHQQGCRQNQTLGGMVMGHINSF